MADILPPHIKKLLNDIQKGTKEEERGILSPEVKKWLADREKGQVELSSEAALHKERMDNTNTESQRYFDDVSQAHRATGRTMTKEEYDRLRQQIMKKYGVNALLGPNAAVSLGNYEGKLGSKDTPQAPYRPFMGYDIDLYGDWADGLNNSQLNYIRMVLAAKLNEKYYGDRGETEGRYWNEVRRHLADDPSRGYMWGLRTEGAPRPMEAPARDPRAAAARRREWGGRADSLGDVDLGGDTKLNMVDVWDNIHKTGGIEAIERYARKKIEEERHGTMKIGIERKRGIGQFTPKAGKAIADSAFDKSELEASKTLEKLEGRTMDSPPLKFEGGGESPQEELDRKVREERRRNAEIDNRGIRNPPTGIN